MNIQPVQLRPGQILHIRCLKCDKPFRGPDAPGSYQTATGDTIMADLDGPAFKAYYHWGCAPRRPDFEIENHGSIVIFQPRNEKAKDWIVDTAPDDAQFWGDGMVVEPRYVQGVIDAAQAAGFEVN